MSVIDSVKKCTSTYTAQVVIAVGGVTVLLLIGCIVAAPNYVPVPLVLLVTFAGWPLLMLFALWLAVSIGVTLFRRRSGMAPARPVSLLDVAIAGAFAGGAIVAIVMYVWPVHGRDIAIEDLSRQVSQLETELGHYQTMSTRRLPVGGAVGVDYQTMMQERGIYREVVRGVACEVDRAGEATWRVVKHRVGSGAFVFATFPVGGPAACDRLQF